MFELKSGAGTEWAGPVEQCGPDAAWPSDVAQWPNGRRTERASLALTARDGGMAARLTGGEGAAKLGKVSTASYEVWRGTRRARRGGRKPTGT